LLWQFFGSSRQFSRRTFQSNTGAGTLSPEAAVANLLSLQRALRKRDRWSGLVVMVMGELFCMLRVRERGSDG
jgi:hypothetical protein